VIPTCTAKWLSQSAEQPASNSLGEIGSKAFYAVVVCFFFFDFL
jgi:hypothetical protein